ncbi:hypothetical protein ABZ951_15190 [Streptomyces sp. NPDC046215]
MTKTARALSILCLTGTLLASAATAHAAPTPPDPEPPTRVSKLVDRFATEENTQKGKLLLKEAPGILSKGAKFGLGTAALGVLLGPVGIAAGSLGGSALGLATGSYKGIKEVRGEAEDLLRAQDSDADRTSPE